MEREFHRWLKERARIENLVDPRNTNRQSNGNVSNGDDAAVFDFFGKPLVIATDTIAEGTHFVIPRVGDVFQTLKQIGHKALAVSLSDIAAMGATPVAATLNFQCPKRMSLNEVTAIYEGAEALSKRFGFQIVGGDTNSWTGELVVSSTVFGTRPAHLAGWSLSDAKVGESIFVSGELGGSIHGRHLTFEPRLELADFLQEKYSVGAATDATDSLTVDLMAIATGSQVRMQIDLSAIPISPDVQPDDRTPLDHALSDGEDFELIFTLSAEEAERLLADSETPTPVTQIGTVIEGDEDEPNIVSRYGDKIAVKGYDH